VTNDLLYKRREFITLVGGAVAGWPLSARAQRLQSRRFRIGWLAFSGAALGVVDGKLWNALSERGLIEARNTEVTFRYANGMPERLGELAVELVAQKPDLLIGIGGDVVRALLGASRGSIPIVGGVSEDPVRAEFSVSLARPGKSFTGVTFITDELAAKRVEFLKEAAKGARRVAAIWNPQHLDDEITFARRAAETLGLTLSSHPATSLSDVEDALREATVDGADSILVIPSRLTGMAAAKIARYGLDHRLPVVAAWREYVESGCLLSYGPNRAFQMRRVAEYVERIMAGAKPQELPIERPTKFELVINLKTSKAIGLEISRLLLHRADEVIE
jgi:putative tryptophan/tyrosine transport system substrate-binding protein